jgi:hypothetical protein
MEEATRDRFTKEVGMRTVTRTFVTSVGVSDDRL